MIEINKRHYNILTGALIFFILLALSFAFSTSHVVEKRVEELKKKDIEIAVSKSKIDDLMTVVQSQKRIIRDQDIEIANLDTLQRHNADVATRTIADLKKDKNKVLQVIRPYLNDTLGLAIALVERDICIKANELIVAQNQILRSKSASQNEVIKTLEEVITLKDNIIVNTEAKVDIYKKENKKLARKLKFSKICTVAVGIAGIVGIIIL